MAWRCPLLIMMSLHNFTWIIFSSTAYLYTVKMSNLGSTFDKGYEQKRIKRSFALYNVGIFCSWAAYSSIFNLQASINVEDGLGMSISSSLSLGLFHAAREDTGFVIWPILSQTFSCLSQHCLVLPPKRSKSSTRKRLPTKLPFGAHNLLPLWPLSENKV